MTKETATETEALLTLPFHRQMIVRGALGVAFGIVSAFWPRDSVVPTALSLRTDVVDNLLMGYLAISALLCLWHAYAKVTPPEIRFWLLGQAIVALPALGFLLFAETPPQLRAALTIWALLSAVCDYMIYRTVRGTFHGSSDFLIAAVVGLLLAVILGLGSTLDSLAILGFTGAATLIAGVIFILGGTTAARRAATTD